MNIRTALLAGFTFAFAGAAAADTPTSASLPRRAPNLPFRFFAMDTGIRDAAHQTPDAQAKMVADLGYDGIGPSGPPEAFAEMLQAVEKHGIESFHVYVGLQIETDPEALPEDFLEICRLTREHKVPLWLFLQSGELKCSDPAGDEKAAALLRAVANKTPHIAIYPHTSFWVERFEDAVRVSDKADLPTVGATFNLCHWLKVEGDRDPLPALEDAMRRKRLHVVTINGADKGDTKQMPWKRLIQNLDAGTYEVGALVRELYRIGYRGPVGLQGYGIGGDVKENLRRSMDAWVKMCADSKEWPGPEKAEK